MAAKKLDNLFMQENYGPWEINFSDFLNLHGLQEKLGFLVKFAVLAPSSHNAQPWRFRIRNSEIDVLPDFRRALPFADPANRLLFIALGCSIENILIAADYYNFKTSITYFPEHEIAARIKFASQEKFEPRESHLIFSIPKRRTNRSRYADRLPDKTFLQWISKNQDDGIKIQIVTDAEKRMALTDIILKTLVYAMENQGFRSEMSEYLRPNITSSKTGMPGKGLGMPLPLSFIAAHIVRRINVNRVNNKKNGILLKNFTPAFGILSAQHDSPDGWIKTGQIFERIALKATEYGIAAGPQLSPIQIGEFYRGVQMLLDIKERPQLIFRLGYPLKETPHTPRLSAKEVTIWN